MIKIFGIGEEKNSEEFDENALFKEEEKEDVGQVAVDILETNEEIIILAPVAGLALEDIDLSFNNSVLSISGFRKKPEMYESCVIIKNSECFWGKFIRNIILPDNLDFNSIKATMENNLLIISIRKLFFESKEIKINKMEN